MTTVAHSIVGATCGVICMPRLKTVIAKAVFLATFVVLGNLPDLPVRNWGHHRYYISHSLFVNAERANLLD